MLVLFLALCYHIVIGCRCRQSSMNRRCAVLCQFYGFFTVSICFKRFTFIYFVVILFLGKPFLFPKKNFYNVVYSSFLFFRTISIFAIFAKISVQCYLFDCFHPLLIYFVYFLFTLKRSFNVKLIHQKKNLDIFYFFKFSCFYLFIFVKLLFKQFRTNKWW